MAGRRRREPRVGRKDGARGGRSPPRSGPSARAWLARTFPPVVGPTARSRSPGPRRRAPTCARPACSACRRRSRSGSRAAAAAPAQAAQLTVRAARRRPRPRRPEQHQAAVVDVVHGGRPRRPRRRDRPRHRDADRHRRALRRRHRRRRPRPAARGAGRQRPPRHRRAGVGDEHRRRQGRDLARRRRRLAPPRPGRHQRAGGHRRGLEGAGRRAAPARRDRRRGRPPAAQPGGHGRALAGAVGPFARQRLGLRDPGGRARPLGRREPRARRARCPRCGSRTSRTGCCRRPRSAGGRRQAATRRSRRGSCRSCAASSPPGPRRRSGRPPSSRATCCAVSSATRPRRATRGTGWCRRRSPTRSSFRFNQSVPAADLNAWWTRQAQRTPRLDPAASPARKLVAVGWRHDVDVALVEPANLRTKLTRLAGASVAELLAAGAEEGRPPTPPAVGHEPPHRARAALAARKLGRGRTPHGRRGAGGRRARRGRPRHAHTDRDLGASPAPDGSHPARRPHRRRPRERRQRTEDARDQERRRRRPRAAGRARDRHEPARPVGDGDRLAAPAEPRRRPAHARRLRLGRRAAPADTRRPPLRARTLDRASGHRPPCCATAPSTTPTPTAGR